MVSTKFLGAIASVLYFTGPSIADVSCPPDGPLLPRPKSLANQDAFKAAGKKLSGILDSVVNGKLDGGFPIENTSFSIAVVSLDDKNGTPAWEYHHRGAKNVNGTKKVDGDSQYLIGSVSKIFTDLLLLKSGLNIDDPITKYLPDLISPDSLIRWENITLQALGAHLGGIQGFYGYPEMSFTVPMFEQLGYPKLSESDFPKCGVVGMNKACSKKELLAGLRDTAPVTTPGLRPEYSTVSFVLLSYAMEVATGKNYTQFLDEQVTKPLHLVNTGASPGDDSKAVIPPIEQNSWGGDYGDNVPGGGLYSSTNDMSQFIRSILTYKLLPQTVVNTWLKPLSTTPQLSTMVGMPWEIYRSAAFTPDHPHTIDLYSKRGSAVGYEAYMGIIDQYGLGFTILTAGGYSEAATNIADSLLSILLPGVEEATRAEAKSYVGNFTTSKEHKSTVRTTMDSGPGLILSNLTSNGSDIVEAIQVLWGTQAVPLGKLSKTLRLFPADVSRSVNVTECVNGTEKVKGQVEEEWRIQYDIVAGNHAPGKLPSAYVVAGACGTFQTPGMLVYGGEALDRIVFVKEGKEVVGVKVPSLRLEYNVRE